MEEVEHRLCPKTEMVHLNDTPSVAGRTSDISCRRPVECRGKMYSPRRRPSITKHKRQVFFKRLANFM